MTKISGDRQMKCDSRYKMLPPEEVEKYKKTFRKGWSNLQTKVHKLTGNEDNNFDQKYAAYKAKQKD